MQTAMRWMGRLTGQGGDADAGEDPVARYFRVNEVTPDASEFPARLAVDMERAIELAAAVDAAAGELIERGGGESRAALSESLGDVETALARSRDVLALFDGLIERVPASAGESVRRDLTVERDMFAVRVGALRERADTLAGLRREFSAPAALS